MAYDFNAGKPRIPRGGKAPDPEPMQARQEGRTRRTGTEPDKTPSKAKRDKPTAKQPIIFGNEEPVKSQGINFMPKDPDIELQEEIKNQLERDRAEGDILP